MSINFHRQRAAILVTEPAGHCGNIHAGFNAPGGKQMAQIVMREARDIQYATRAIEGTLALLHPHDRIVSFCVVAFSSKTLQ